MSGDADSAGVRLADRAPGSFLARALDVLARENGGAAAAQPGTPAVLAAAPIASALPAIPTIPAIPSSAQTLESLRARARDWIDDLLSLVSAGTAIAATPPPPGVGAALPSLPAALSDARALSPGLSLPAAVRPGDVVRLPMRLANDAIGETLVSLIATDLIAASGDRIPASNLTFWPERLAIGPAGQAAVEIKVMIPAQLPPGRYGGLIQVVGQPDARSLLTIAVG